MLFTAAFLVAVSAGSAAASPNNAPSKASDVKVAVPFTGNWTGTVYQHGNSFNHWWRLPTALRPGDSIQLAVDNRLSNRTLNFCLVSPVDDFGADAALEGCSSTYVEPGQQSRISLTYGGGTGRAYLIAWISNCCGDRGEAVPASYEAGQYTVTIEQIVQLVNIGLAIPASLPSTFTAIANLTYGDNTPAADGIPAFLQWRPVAPRGSEPAPFANLVTALSSGGTATFTGTVPTSSQGRKIQLRACVAQPGSTAVRCAESVRTAVAASPCSRALANQQTFGRVVRRLAKRLQRAHSRVAKIRLKRKLRAKRQRLAVASRNVSTYCV